MCVKGNVCVYICVWGGEREKESPILEISFFLLRDLVAQQSKHLIMKHLFFLSSSELPSSPLKSWPPTLCFSPQNGIYASIAQFALESHAVSFCASLIKFVFLLLIFLMSILLLNQTKSQKRKEEKFSAPE